MKNSSLRRVVMAVAALCAAIAMHAGKYQHFKVSTYIRTQDVARMDDDYRDP